MLVEPKTFLFGFTEAYIPGIKAYLEFTEQQDFWEEFEQALKEGISSGEALCSLYAKMCYKSLVLGQNLNVTKIRSIEKNIKGTMDSGHGSVFEHCTINFVTTRCSRVFTHELVRHRVGTAFSQTSGRYVAIDKIDLVLPPELKDNPEVLGMIQTLNENIENCAKDIRKILIDDAGITDFATKKKITSAIRRIAPNGQDNEIGWSCNIRSLRHLLVMRTSRHAEWEIRHVFNEVGNIIGEKFPNMLYGLNKELVEGLYEYTGQKL